MNTRMVPFLMFAFSATLLADLPDRVEEAETLEPGTWTLDLGALYRDEPQDFGVTEERDFQVDFGRTRFSFGLGKVVELQLTGTAIVAIIEPFGENQETENNSGDWDFATKVWLWNELGWRPNVSFYYSVKLPNASEENGSGTDETDFSTSFLFDKSITEDFRLHLNLGLAILGDPFTNSAQNDVFSFGLGSTWQVSNRARLTAAVGGETGPELEDDPSGVQLSFTRKLLDTKWAWYLSGIAGFSDDTDNFVVQVGFRRGFKLFQNTPRERFNNW